MFASVNHTLGRVPETRQRRLNIRTYRIIPTTPQTGLIEFVEHTQAFGHWLSHGSGCAHSRYHPPPGLTSAECRKRLAECANADRVLKFREIVALFPPVFRFFFIEKYPDPARWAACRLAYTRSVAVNSIVGYILGIGDRHAHNIMVDTRTAEVVHIDFGIVFEQGRVLTTPETVPFRLTRDVVDGMGVTGVEGSFRRSCEEVLRVLRDQAPRLLTILEVVLHDPLYKWSLSPLQARARQGPALGGEEAAAGGAPRRGRGSGAHNLPVAPGAAAAAAAAASAATAAAAAAAAAAEAGFGRDAAERTLRRIRSKLQGFEDPSGEGLGVEGQVELVMSMAMDEANLARLFVGWAPWL